MFSEDCAALFLGKVFPWTGVTLKFSKKKKRKKEDRHVFAVCVGGVLPVESR